MSKEFQRISKPPRHHYRPCKIRLRANERLCTVWTLKQGLGKKATVNVLLLFAIILKTVKY